MCPVSTWRGDRAKRLGRQEAWVGCQCEGPLGHAATAENCWFGPLSSVPKRASTCPLVTLVSHPSQRGGTCQAHKGDWAFSKSFLP